MLIQRKEGFTLVEMMIAMVILTVAILGVAGSTSRMSIRAADAEVRAKAIQAVEDQITRVTLDPRYALLDSIYGGTDDVTDLEDFSRVTTLADVTVTLPSGVSLTYQKLTVAVDGPYLSKAVARTVVLGAP